MTQPAELVLLIGAPRSGTTWLQQLLGAHPLVTTPQETDVFSRFLQPLYTSWEREVRGGQTGIEKRRFKGLHSVLNEDQFTAIGSDFLGRVIANAVALKPGSKIVVEKTPGHSLCSSSIAQFAPHAKIIHLIRDGRDVASSLVSSGNGWGSWWAPKSVTRASQLWREYVEGARIFAGSGDYLEVKYEELQTHGPSTLERVFAHIGLTTTLRDCEMLIESFALENMAAGTTSIIIGGDFAEMASERNEPPGFFGKGGSGSWRSDWDADQRMAFDDAAGGLLIDLSYEATHAWAGDPSEIARFRRRRLRSDRSVIRLERFVVGLNRLRRQQP